MKIRMCLKRGALLATILLGSAHTGFGQSSEYRGLWVGSVSLRYVNEVAIPLDEQNNPIASNPQMPTPTFDEANLRLLMHVNGAGQVVLLKDVAILNRAVSAGGSADPNVFANETDLALVTDPRLYSSFAPQPAQRFATATFDFGEPAATRALDVLVEAATPIATNAVMASGLDLGSQGLRVQAQQAISAQIVSDLQPMADNADVAESFNQFLQQANASLLTSIAAANGSSPLVTDAMAQAVSLRDLSFYQDARGIDMLDAVVAAVTNAAPADRDAAAHNTASAFADVENRYQRFISGQTFGNMILAAAEAAGPAAQEVGATAALVVTALRALPESIEAIGAANNAKVAAYNDSRSLTAVDQVLGAMATAAVTNAALSVSDIAAASETAGRAALSGMVARYPLPVQTPTPDYNQWVRSSDYAGALQTLADAIAKGAVDERADNVLATADSVAGAARVAAVTALEGEYAMASRVPRAELPLSGAFGPGSGDARPLAELAQASDLGPPGLVGVLILPAQHPTNPFRHRRHPDHTRGFDIERRIRLDFAGMTGDALETAAFGVDRVTGIYREEIFGLHKPLGPDPETAPIGLKTEGRFQLNRISYIDTLNTR